MKFFAQTLWGIEVSFRAWRLWITGMDRYIAVIEMWLEKKNTTEAQRLVNEMRTRYGETVETVRSQTRIDIYIILEK